jgi:hypothetical protein
MGQREQPEQFELINEILQLAFDAAPDEWREMILNHYGDDEQCTISSSVLIDNGAGDEEQDVETSYEMVELFEQLREHLAESGKPKFSHCKIHITSDGQYEATYSYDEIDWEALFLPDSDFFPTRSKFVKPAI